MAKLGEISAWLEVPETGLEVEIVRLSSVGDARVGSLVFAMEERTLEAAVRSAASGILANDSLRSGGVQDARILWVEDAKLAFARVAQRMAGRRAGPAEVDARAVIEAGVVLGEGTRVGPGAVIGAGVVIGRECTILANATIYAGSVLGDRVVVQAGAVVGSTGFGYVRDRKTGAYVAFPQQGTVILEDDVEVGANTTIDRGALGETRIGRGTKIDNLVHVAHNCVIGRDVVIAAQTGISGSTVVGDRAVIGGQVGIGDHAVIGDEVILGSGSGVLSGKKLRGAGQVFWGIPAQPLKQYLRELARSRRER